MWARTSSCAATAACWAWWHLGHDRAALRDLLGLLAGKKMVLIDTTGVASATRWRKRELLDVLDLPGVQRLLVLNASSHGDTLDDVLTGLPRPRARRAICPRWTGP